MHFFALRSKQALGSSNIQILFVLANKMSSSKLDKNNLEIPEPGTIIYLKITEGKLILFGKVALDI
jgi:hypothetical protein